MQGQPKTVSVRAQFARRQHPTVSDGRVSIGDILIQWKKYSLFLGLFLF